MVALLSDTERRSFHHRYRNSDLFRQWSAILCQLEREADEMDAVSLWYLAEKCLSRLRDIQQYRDEEIPYIYNELINECRVFCKGRDTIERSSEAAERSAVAVMCVMLTSLMNAVEKGHETEDFDNKAMCVAIVRLLNKNLYFTRLMDAFFGRKIGNDGKKVVIAPADPMKKETAKCAMDESAKEDIEETVNFVSQKTGGLKAEFKKGHWEHWVSVWRDICDDSELITIIKKTGNPRGSDWVVNEKMVFNVLGIFIEVFGYKNFVSTACKAITEKNRRDYITNHAYKCGNSTELSTQEIHERVESIVKSKISS